MITEKAMFWKMFVEHENKKVCPNLLNLTGLGGGEFRGILILIGLIIGSLEDILGFKINLIGPLEMLLAKKKKKKVK